MAMWRWIWFIAVGGAAVTSGCTSGTAVSCSDPATIDSVLKIVRQNHDDGYGYADSPIMRARIEELAAKSYALSDVTTRTRATAESAAISCSATLTYRAFRIERDLHATQKEWESNPASLTRTADQEVRSKVVRFTVQKTDEGKTLVEVTLD